jgi:hypothetical protein
VNVGKNTWVSGWGAHHKSASLLHVRKSKDVRVTLSMFINVLFPALSRPRNRSLAFLLSKPKDIRTSQNQLRLILAYALRGRPRSAYLNRNIIKSNQSVEAQVVYYSYYLFCGKTCQLIIRSDDVAKIIRSEKYDSVPGGGVSDTLF